MKRPTCKTCPYWGDAYSSYDDEPPEYRGGKLPELPAYQREADTWCCLRHAPKPGRTEDKVTYWPETWAGDSCGEHPDYPEYIAAYLAARRTLPPGPEDEPA